MNIYGNQIGKNNMREISVPKFSEYREILVSHTNFANKSVVKDPTGNKICEDSVSVVKASTV